MRFLKFRYNAYMNPIKLSLFYSRMSSICHEMGALLMRCAISSNIKDRLDFSCAIFDVKGQPFSQASHIPVHLGSMAFAMSDIVNSFSWSAGDMMVLNDPFLGGTHLPDVTMIAPVFIDNQLLGFVANRAHHADIGSDSPGSMPVSSDINEEGLLISPQLIVKNDQVVNSFMVEMLGHMRNKSQSSGDFRAQISANRLGVRRVTDVINKLGVTNFFTGVDCLNDYAEKMALSGLKKIPDGVYDFEDFMEDDGLGNENIVIKVSVKVCQGQVTVDFTGTHQSVEGNINCPLAVTAASVFYVFRCLMPAETPACSGSLRPIVLNVATGALVNASRPSAVAAGNVETSSRIVDVLLGALAKAIPHKIPAASQGTMNNVAMGADTGEVWDYYETLAGGMGAGPQGGGLHAVHTHMTNTLNTPIESLEMQFPLQIEYYEVREESGGKGIIDGGDGIVRAYRFKYPTRVSLISERRRLAPWGINEGGSGSPGVNMLNNHILPGKTNFLAQTGQVLSIATPGGGGWGCEKAC